MIVSTCCLYGVKYHDRLHLCLYEKIPTIVSTRISTENIPTTSLQRYLYGHPYAYISTNISLSRVLLYDITYVRRNYQYDAKSRIRFPPSW